jgi:glucose-1-phosphate cytidylyltransferase
MDYFMHNSDMTIELGSNKVDIHYTQTESFKVTLVDTGLNTKTAGRLQRIKKYVGQDTFMLTYGDGVSDVNVPELVRFHQRHGKVATVTAIQPEARFGGMELDEENKVQIFKEKPKGDGRWINGGFFVLSPKVFDYLDDKADQTMWEDQPLELLSKGGQLMAYKHSGFWKCMDAMRDKIELEQMWHSGEAKWKVWQ